MKKRYIYSVLFGIPGLIVSGIIALMVFGATAGILWIFVYGDNPWPSFIEKALPALFVLVFLIAGLACIAAGFVIGKKNEQNPVLNKSHILISIGITLAAVLFIVIYQLSVGNIGPKPDSLRCSEFCSQKGYSASSMPPRNSGERTCSCLNDSGIEILKVPVDSLDLLK